MAIDGRITMRRVRESALLDEHRVEPDHESVAGARPVYVDTEPDGFNQDLDQTLDAVSRPQAGLP